MLIYLFLTCTHCHIHLFITTLGLYCCREWGLLSSSGAQASHCSGFSCCRAQALGTWASVAVVPGLQSSSSIVMVHGLSCSVACGIFPDQGSNPYFLHWQTDSLPWSRQRSPLLAFLTHIDLFIHPALWLEKWFSLEGDLGGSAALKMWNLRQITWRFLTSLCLPLK